MESKIKKLSASVIPDANRSVKIKQHFSPPRMDSRNSQDPFWRNATFRKYETRARSNPAVFLWGDSFRPANPIHSLLAVESELVSPQKTQKAYETLTPILKIVKEVNARACLSPQEKLALVYDTLHRMGIQFQDMDDPLLTHNLLQNRLDCDTSSFVVMAVAHEMGWPVHLVVVPNHVFVRWDDGKGTRFNMDFGEIHPDEYYIETMKIPPETVRKGIHLKNLSPSETLALFLHNRGTAKADHGKLAEAIGDYTEALFLNPNYADAYLDRGRLRNELEQYPGATQDLIRAGRIDSRYSGAKRNVEDTREFRKILSMRKR